MLYCRSMSPCHLWDAGDQAQGLCVPGKHCAKRIKLEPNFHFCMPLIITLLTAHKFNDLVKQTKPSHAPFCLPVHIKLNDLPTCLGASLASTLQRCCHRLEAANSPQMFTTGDTLFSLTCNQQALRRVRNSSVARFLKYDSSILEGNSEQSLVQQTHGTEERPILTEQ